MSWRKIKCWFGSHAPNCINKEGKYIVQRCLYCDRVIHKFESKDDTIRRVV